MKNINIQELLDKHKNNQCSKEELAQIENWYLQWETPIPEVTTQQLIETQISTWNKLESKVNPPRRLYSIPQISIAAAVLFTIVSVAFYVFLAKDKSQQASYANDVPPGKIGATLTLSDGKAIKLNTAKNELLLDQAGLTIRKSKDGQLIYQADEKREKVYGISTLATGNGETYQLILPDGSRIWLNAASSISFSGGLTKQGKRKVILQGEAYFEISKDKAHPFIVESQGQEIEVLGTHFNVNSYSEDNEIKTTLLEGSVKVSARGMDKILVPGMEAINNGGNIQVIPADTQLAVAWKNDKFVFENESIESIMRKVSRWYNVSVHYRGTIPPDAFEGSVSRFDSVSKVLGILESTGRVHFEIQGRDIYVSK